MFSRKIWFAAAALASFQPLCMSATAENPQQCFTLASLQGSYAIVGTYGANVALALGKRYYDGKG
ncbi:MAG TPA: hypothetical protein VGG59_11015, partial [Acidobacteriaceae bacterium]